MPLATGTRLGPYEIISLLGTGGMGEVYQARDTRLDRIVAIKTLTPRAAINADKRRRFEREALAVAALSHPHICAFYDIGHDEGVDFLVMEYLEGETLEHRLVRGPLLLDEALRLGRQIADALDQVHRHGLAHRDLKPSNIMLTRSGAKLLDFGLAKLVDSSSLLIDGAPPAVTASLTAEGTILGTLQYMAPEQLQGGQADHRTDLFAFGAVMYEMVTGQKAFAGASAASQIAAVLSTDPPALSSIQPTIPRDLDRLIQRCLAKDPDDRWQTARDLLAELVWLAEGNSGMDGILAAIANDKRRRVAWSVAAIACVVAVAAVASRFLNRTSSPEPGVGVLRFSVGPPQDMEFSGGGGVLALSPDGRFLAFVASTGPGNDKLWLRSLDSPEARPLDGTEGAGQPFWSPDSRFVAFAAPGGLKKIDVSNGLVQTLCETSGYALSGSWNREGVVLFSVPYQGLYRISAAGGIPAAVTTPDLSKGELAHAWPVFLPDGRHFVFLVNSTRPESAGLYVGSLDSPERSRILPVLSNALYTRGHLLYQRQAALVAQAFDTKTFRVTGEPIPVAENVAQNPATKRAVASVSSDGVLAYRTTGSTELRWFDRKGTQLETVGPPGQYGSPTLSQDDRQVVVSRLDPQLANEDIWSFETASGRARRLTFDRGSDAEPVWSPDGARILFASNRRGSFDLYQMTVGAVGQQEELLLSAPGSLSPRDWTIDGQIAYETYERRVLLLSPGSGAKPRTLFTTGFAVDHVRVSPDRRWIAYSSNESGIDEVYVRPFLSAAPNVWQVSARGGTAPQWRSDEQELFYLGSNQTVMAVAVKSGSRFEAATPRPLFRVRGTQTMGRPLDSFAVTRDGRRFLINQPASGVSPPITVVVNWAAVLTR